MFCSPNFKINIGLFITKKRKDGFHDIETIFYPVYNQTDKIEMTASDDGVSLVVKNKIFTCSIENNLCVKAFRLLEKDFHLPGVQINLTKNIPVGAGLGGGSADAAFSLKLLNEIFQLNLSNDKLKEYAVLLGSDVPFFIDNQPSFASGKGEVLETVALDLSNKIITVIKPPFSISTAEAYRNIIPREAPFSLKKIGTIPVEKWKNYIRNDFEESIFIQFPVLQEIKMALYDAGADYVSLTGSGSALYAISGQPVKINFPGLTVF